MNIDYFYELTPRQYANIETGYYTKQNNRSKELWMMTRKIMYAALLPNTKNLKENQLISFPWETDGKIFTEEEHLALIDEVENVKSFWEEQDKKKAAAQL